MADDSKVEWALAFCGGEKLKEEFGEKYNLFRPIQHVKNCLVIKFDFKKDSAREQQYNILQDSILKNFELSIPTVNTLPYKTQPLPLVGRLTKLGILLEIMWDHIHYLVPNEFVDVQKYLIANCPSWAVIRNK